MDKQIICNHIIEVFKDYPVKEQLEMTKDVVKVRELLVNKYGLKKWLELLSASLGDWRGAWQLFNQHHGIFTEEENFEEFMNE